jgi:hypothetical protein
MFERGIGNAIAIDIQPEVLALDAAAIGKVDLEIETHTLVGHAVSSQLSGLKVIRQTIPARPEVFSTGVGQA